MSAWWRISVAYPVIGICCGDLVNSGLGVGAHFTDPKTKQTRAHKMPSHISSDCCKDAFCDPALDATLDGVTAPSSVACLAHDLRYDRWCVYQWL